MYGERNNRRRIVTLGRAGYYQSLPRLSEATINQLLDVLREKHLRIEQLPSECLSGAAYGSKITQELMRLRLYVARGLRSWSGLVICFPGNKEELTTGFVGTPYLRRILHPMLDLFLRLRSAGAEDLQCVYILGERFPDVFLRKFKLLEQVIPHVIVLTGDILKFRKATAIPPIPKSKNEAWAQTTLCRAMENPAGLAVPYRGLQARLGYISTELPTGEGTRNPERLDILAYDKKDRSLVAIEIKGPRANRVEIENLFLQGLEHRNWLERNKMAVKLMFDGVRGRRINTRKRVRLLLACFEDRIPPLFNDLREKAMRKDRHLGIDFGRLVETETGGLEVVPFPDCASMR
jgi:hypothetical protein